MRVEGLVSGLLEAALPARCLHCGGALAGSDRSLCGSCLAKLRPAGGVVCTRCAAPGALDGESCLACVARPPAQAATVVWGEYDGPLRTAILSLKHGGHDGLAAALGDRLAALVGQQPWCSEITEITGIPSHPWRRLRRGPPAAFELARTLARQLDRPQRRLLRRRGLGRQMSRRRSQRLALPAETFAPAGRPGRTPLIVDDVVTTGATLDRAARSLLTAGADRVYCAAVARTPDARRVT